MAPVIEQETNDLREKLKSTDFHNYGTRAEIFKRLSELHPNSQDYAAKYVENKQKKERADELRPQFSLWDGCHLGLRDYTKKNLLNDPKSFDHLKTIFADNGDHLIVNMTFTADNAFGGTIKHFIKAKVSPGGTVLEILMFE